MLQMPARAVNFFTVGVLPIAQSLSLNVNFANRNPTAGKRYVVSFDPDYE